MRRSPLAVVVVSCLAPLAVATATTRAQSVVDPDLTVQPLVSGLDAPTGVALLPGSGGGDALVIEKNTGRVKLVRGGDVAATVLDLPVANNSERGLLGIATHPDFATNPLVYLSYTASTADGGFAYDNRVERYRWDAAHQTLAFDRRVLRMPSQPGPNHNGGKIAFGPDGKLYAVVGDVARKGQTSNFTNTPELLRTGAVLRINPSGTTPPTNPFFDASIEGTRRDAVNDVYAYGVRNSFGIAFDPVRGDLWDTENGPGSFDEINRLRPGANSGWQQVMGPVARTGASTDDLVALGDRAYYSDPRLAWQTPVAPTDLEFLGTDLLGGAYENDLFVGTTLTGALLRFDLSPSRRTLSLAGPLADGVADNSAGDRLGEQSGVVFGDGFGTITDLVTGPDGLYVLSFTDGTLYRIAPGASPGVAMAALAAVATPEPGAVAGLALGAAALLLRPRRRRHRDVRGQE
jgi:glucose/arabinose dehydrogenase